MSEPDARAGDESDELAARLLSAHRLLAGLRVAAEERIRLNLRFVAICTSLKMPGSSRDSCALRLDQLMAEAEQAEANCAERV
jgi:hypothetical protein